MHQNNKKIKIEEFENASNAAENTNNIGWDSDHVISTYDLNDSTSNNFYNSGEVILKSHNPDILEAMEINASNCLTSVVPPDDQFKLWTELCEEIGFEPPIPLEEFKKTKWNHASTYTNEDLSHGLLLPLADMKTVKRRWNIPICHPGPMLDDETNTEGWYYPDSILVEVKLLDDKDYSYIVRWVGYEDEYNTIETRQSLEDTAVLEIFEKRNCATASQGGVGLLRRSKRLSTQKQNVAKCSSMNSNNEHVSMLDTMLTPEIQANKYSPNIGFYSINNVVTQALDYQLEFMKQFYKMMSNISTPNFYFHPKPLGCVFGSLTNCKKFKDYKKTGSTKPPSNKTYIYKGWEEARKLSKNKEATESNPHYVSFLVMSKYDVNETAEDNHLKMHMYVLTMRTKGKSKFDAVIFDPIKKCFKQFIPDFLTRLIPRPEPLTRRFGTSSKKGDCVYQSMKYIIDLHTGKIPFEHNYEESY